MSNQQTIYLAGDHGGFELKNQLVDHLSDSGRTVKDLGPTHFDPDDDYPDFVLPMIKSMLQDDFGVGILICRSSEGVCMAANRNPSFRAAIATTVEQAVISRQHNNANILCLSADTVDFATNLKIVEAFLNTEFSDEPRHARRLRKIEQYFPLG